MNWTSENYYFTKLNRKELPELLHFYLDTTQEHYKLNEQDRQNLMSDFKSLMGEDLSFFDQSFYYVLRAKIDNSLQASIRITYWDRKTCLPIEKLFAIEAKSLILPHINHFWHIGRFVISGKIEGNRINILKKMLFDAFYAPYTLGKGLIIAECDRKLVNTLRKLKIESHQLGPPIIYLYSETLPIHIKSESLETFIQKNAGAQCSIENNIDLEKFINMSKDNLMNSENVDN